jgi:hypothetical protein
MKVEGNRLQETAVFAGIRQFCLRVPGIFEEI